MKSRTCLAEDPEVGGVVAISRRLSVYIQTGIGTGFELTLTHARALTAGRLLEKEASAHDFVTRSQTSKRSAPRQLLCGHGLGEHRTRRRRRRHTHQLSFFLLTLTLTTAPKYINSGENLDGKLWPRRAQTHSLEEKLQHTNFSAFHRRLSVPVCCCFVFVFFTTSLATTLPDSTLRCVFG